MDIKTGWKTTEFWVSLATGICGLLVTVGVFDAGQASDISVAIGKIAGAVILAISSGAYAISRSKSKSENPVAEKKDEVVGAE